jgi:chromosome segregation ATPase
MAKKKLFVLALGVVVLVLLTTAGCTAKKKVATIEEQKVQVEKADNRINELQQSNEALDKNLKDTQSALAAAQSENSQLKQAVGSLKDQVAGLESQKAELASKAAADKESYNKKTRSLNGQIGVLKKDLAEKEARIASKDAEISQLQTREAALKAAADDQSRKMAALNSEKDALSAQLKKTVSGKNLLIGILAVLLALAVILAVVAFVRSRRTAAVG